MKKMMLALGLFVFGFSLQVQAATYTGINGLIIDASIPQDQDSFSKDKIAAHSAVDDIIEFKFTGYPAVLSINSTLPASTWDSFAVSLWDNSSFVGAAIASVSGVASEIKFTKALAAGTYWFHVLGKVGAQKGTYQLGVYATPVPGAVWLMGSALMGLVGVSRRKSSVNGLAA